MAFFKWFKSKHLRKRVIRELQLTAISLLFMWSRGLVVIGVGLLASNLYFLVFSITLFLLFCLNRYMENLFFYDSNSKKDLVKINNDGSSEFDVNKYILSKEGMDAIKKLQLKNNDTERLKKME